MKNLVVMASIFAILFEDAFMEYGKTSAEKFDTYVIPLDLKNKMNAIDYFMFKKNICNRKKDYYDNMRTEIINMSKQYDRIIFINCYYDEEYLIDARMAHELEGIDCRIYFVDPMSELPVEFQYWHIFTNIFTFEYKDLDEFAKPQGLNVEFLPLGSRYYLYNKGNESLVDKIHDICFVGLGTSERLLYLEKVAKYCTQYNKKMFVAGHFWHNNNCLSSIIGKYKFKKKFPNLSKYVINKFVEPKDLYELYRKSRVCLNINTPGHDTFNSRNIDIMYSGGIVLTERENLSGYDLVEGKHFYSCDNPDDMVEKLKYLLDGKEDYNEVCFNAQTKIMEKYLFTNNIDTLIKN